MRIPSILVLLFWLSVLAQSLVIPVVYSELVRRSEDGTGKPSLRINTAELPTSVPSSSEPKAPVASNFPLPSLPLSLRPYKSTPNLGSNFIPSNSLFGSTVLRPGQEAPKKPTLDEMQKGTESQRKEQIPSLNEYPLGNVHKFNPAQPMGTFGSNRIHQLPLGPTTPNISPQHSLGSSGGWNSGASSRQQSGASEHYRGKYSVGTLFTSSPPSSQSSRPTTGNKVFTEEPVHMGYSSFGHTKSVNDLKQGQHSFGHAKSVNDLKQGQHSFGHTSATHVQGKSMSDLHEHPPVVLQHEHLETKSTHDSVQHGHHPHTQDTHDQNTHDQNTHDSVLHEHPQHGHTPPGNQHDQHDHAHQSGSIGNASPQPTKGGLKAKFTGAGQKFTGAGQKVTGLFKNMFKKGNK